MCIVSTSVSRAMAMLAEPKRRVPRVNVRASTTWSQDDTKFGKRLLEKMGWSQGRGLGANLDGETKSVPLRVKLDSKGLGFTAKDDQWTSHETLFQGLLQDLNGDSSASTPAPIVASLEKKSKNLQSRIHYKKFTRGKDISQYSPKDLANIFGKRTLETPPEPEKSENEPVSTEENSSYNFVSAGNINDYFTSKKNFKSSPKLEKDEESCDFAFRGFSGAQSYPEDDKPVENDIKIIEDEPIKENKKKKRKIEDKNCEFSFIGFTSAQSYPEDDKPIENDRIVENEPIEKKKKKKRKVEDKNREFSFIGFTSAQSYPEEVKDEPNEYETVENEKVKSKKKKKRKPDDPDANCDYSFTGFSHADVISNEPAENENEPIKSKKKKKRKLDSDVPQEVNCDTSVKKKKKKAL